MAKVDCLSPVILKSEDGFQQRVRCNHCLNCGIRRQLAWTLRLCLEKRSTECASFVTSTYSDTARRGKLHYPDVQLFLKRLRKSFPKPVRFFSCGQYGTRYGREHWHTILFGVSALELCQRFGACYGAFPGRDLQGLAEQPTGLWPHGSTHIAEFNVHRARYVARYALKTGAEPTANVVQMSRRPGIGLDALRQIGIYLAGAQKSWERVPTWWKMGNAYHPLDGTAVRTLQTAMEAAGASFRLGRRSDLSRDMEARISVLVGDVGLPKAAISVTHMHARDIERSVF